MGKTKRTIRKKAAQEDAAPEAAAPEPAPAGKDEDPRDRISAAFRTLSDPVALDILLSLAVGDVSVPEIAEHTGQPPTLVAMYVADFTRRGITTKGGGDDPARCSLVDQDIRTILTQLGPELRS